MIGTMQKLRGASWSARKGFTLLETLLTLSIIAALTIMTISSINPGRMLAQSRNGIRWTRVNDLLGAITVFTIDNDGQEPSGVTLPPVPGPTTFSGAYLIEGSYGDAQSIFTMDIDADGDLDVVGGSKGGTGDVSWWEHSGTGTPTEYPLTWTKHTVDSGFKGWVVRSGDIDGDSLPDIVASDKDNKRVSWWRNLGAAVFGASVDIEPSYQSARALDLANMDGDTDLDVIAGSDKNEAIRWWRNDGSPLTPDWNWKAPESSKKDYIGSLVGVDLDGDTDMDIVASYESTLTWWENDGDPWQNNWTQYDIDSTSETWEEVYVGNLDGDGDTDVVAISTNGRLSWWENDGTPAQNDWTEHVIASNFGGTAVSLVDFDLDGDLDVLGASEGGDKIAWWENEGGGVFAGTSVITSGGEVDGVTSVSAADVDGDGDLDVVAGMEVAGTIAWWENLSLAGYSQSAPVANVGGVFKPLCKFGVSVVACDANGGVSVDVLVPGHIAAIPVDPLSESDPVLTGFEVRHDAGTISLFVRAAFAELGKTIQIVGPVGVANCLVWDVLNNERTCVLFE